MLPNNRRMRRQRRKSKDDNDSLAQLQVWLHHAVCTSEFREPRRCSRDSDERQWAYWIRSARRRRLPDLARRVDAMLASSGCSVTGELTDRCALSADAVRTNRRGRPRIKLGCTKRSYMNDSLAQLQVWLQHAVCASEFREPNRTSRDPVERQWANWILQPKILKTLNRATL